MSSLYRRYRPTQFSEVVGQDHIISSLTNMLASDQIDHAFLFSGPRGTGKTSLARLLARSINCIGKKKGVEPCGQCAICLEILNNQSVDIIEIDAASNRGIDEIRDLREKIAYAPTRSKYKVYIIDEVHMLTKEAFNALLKTLEEPPTHAIFILATTELHKVPETIISRCQRYQFHRASTEKLVSVLQNVAKQEKISLDAEAAALLAERADGSFRDALTMLGNVQSSGALDSQSLRALIGLPPAETLSSVLTFIHSQLTIPLAQLLNQFIADGGDLSVLVRTLANTCRQKIFTAPEATDLNQSAELLEKLLVLLVKARHSIDATSLLAAGLIGLAAKKSAAAQVSTVKTDPPKASVTQQTEKEAPIIPVAPVATPAVTVSDTPPSVTDLTATAPFTPPAVDAVSATPTPVAEPGQFWPNFLEAIKEKNHALYAIISSAKFEGLTDDKLSIAVKFRFYSERLFESKNRNLVEAVATAVAGRPLSLDCLVKTDLDTGVSREEDLLSTVVEVFEINE